MEEQSRLNQLLHEFVGACLDVFGDQRVECVMLHGSSVKGGAIPGFSDVDLMVFLSADCFNRGEVLRDELAFAIQQRTGAMPWREAGFLYHQGFFRNAESFENWWTIPGAYRLLH